MPTLNYSSCQVLKLTDIYSKKKEEEEVTFKKSIYDDNEEVGREERKYEQIKRKWKEDSLNQLVVGSHFAAGDSLTLRSLNSCC